MSQILTQTRNSSAAVIGLIGVTVAADVLAWHAYPGLGVVAFIVTVACAAQALWGRFEWQAWVILALSLFPAIEVFGALSIMFALLGLSAFCAVQVCGGWGDTRRVVAATVRFPLEGNMQSCRDIWGIARDETRLRQSALGLFGGLRDWMIPLVLGSTFVLLFAMANPVIDDWIVQIWPENGPTLPPLERFMFWVFAAGFAWPMLRLRAVSSRLFPSAAPRRPEPVRLLREGSTLRSLITFNAIFAVQTCLDIAYLSGGVSLPDGITYAAYAHRGAYPLLLTALLAGGFALIAQPWLKGRPVLRWLLLIWVGQNVILVISSILRLDLYVDFYGLTRLRFAAFVWMALVALGLLLMMWQVLREWPVGWLVQQSAALGALALFLVSLTNVDGRIAHHNLSMNVAGFDAVYLCGLSEGALPAIRQHEVRTGKRFCDGRAPFLRQPLDWREWGYRNARLRHKLSEIEGLSQ